MHITVQDQLLNCSLENKRKTESWTDILALQLRPVGSAAEKGCL
jgi:hypothetical protein